MEYLEFKELLIEKLNYINENLSEEQINNLFLFMNNLLEWNERINLTAIKNPKDIIVKHFVDSIYIKKYINGKMLDIGSGAGFPGIPLKISNEDIDITSVDSVNKKISFQKDSIEKLKFLNYIAVHSRVEDLASSPEYREKFDFVTSRAVANMSTLVEYMLPFLKINGFCICMKGPNSDEELEKSMNAIKILGGEIAKVENYKIDDQNERTLIIIKKVKHTPREYPRRQGKPLKSPLK